MNLQHIQNPKQIGTLTKLRTRLDSERQILQNPNPRTSRVPEMNVLKSDTPLYVLGNESLRGFRVDLSRRVEHIDHLAGSTLC